MIDDKSAKINSLAKIIPVENGHGGYVALFENDLMLPVTDLFDEDGDPCEFKDAAVAIAGRDGDGWYTIDIHDGYSRTN